MTISELVREYRATHNISQRQFADIAGLSNGYVSMIENNINPATGMPPKLSLNTLKKVAKGLGITLTDLMEEAEDIPVSLANAFDDDSSKITPFPALQGMTKEERRMVRKYRTLDNFGTEAVDAVLDAEYRRMTKIADPEHEGWNTYIPYFDLAVSAGTGEPWTAAAHATRLSVPTERVPEKANYCVRVNGDSMEPAYRDGDIVFVQRIDDGDLREGEIGIFSLNGEGYIKRFGDHELISLNPAYNPIPIHEYDGFEAQGRVLGKL